MRNQITKSVCDIGDASHANENFRLNRARLLSRLSPQFWRAGRTVPPNSGGISQKALNYCT